MACLLAVLFCSGEGVASDGPRRHTPSAGELALMLDKLEVLGSVLYVAAHPDDENTAFLSYLSRGELARTAYLSITRGDGGQNLIGNELGELLGVIRTQELLEARHRDGAEQFFTRAVDFGYTKSVDEALETWGHEQVLSDVVRLFRTFRPDVVVMRFPGDGRGGHGQHTASAVLAAEAFEAAGDADRFPEQLAGENALEAWQPTRLLWDAARFFGGGSFTEEGVVVDVGAYSPQLGESFTEIAAASRSMHKSQGFGAASSRGRNVGRLEHRAGTPARDGLFDGIDTSWARVGAPQIGEQLARAARAFDVRQPHSVVPQLLEARRSLQERLTASDEDHSTRFWLQHKSAELDAVILAACGLHVEVLASRATITPGATLDLEAKVINRSPVPVRLRSIELPFPTAGADSEVEETPLAPNELWTHDFEVTVPAGATTDQPYWLRDAAAGALFSVAEPEWIGLAESPRRRAQVELLVQDQLLFVEPAILYRWVDRVEGERYRDLAVVPAVSVELQPEVAVFSTAEPRTIELLVEAPAGRDLEARLRLPAGWASGPAQRFRSTEQPHRLGFEVTSSSLNSVGVIQAEVSDPASGETYHTQVVTIDYPHMPVQVVQRPALSKVARVDLERRGERIGYVMGAGDEVPQALRQVGYEVILLSDEDLAAGDLQQYDAIVTGVRAFNARPAVTAHLPRLLQYVYSGGTLVNQYNTVSRRARSETAYGPYPFQVSRDRVSVETAPMTFIEPDHPVLSGPNRITAADFEGWVQERGLYFPNEWDERYSAPLASNDPGEPPRQGGLLVARYGEGVYVYTGYSFFRELPAGVPGAYRLFVNLLSARGEDFD